MCANDSRRPLVWAAGDRQRRRQVGQVTQRHCRQHAPGHQRQAFPCIVDRFLAQAAGGGLWFGLPVTGIGNSVVSLSVVADGMRLATNMSPGRITSARVCQFANASCGSVQALQQTGYLQASVQNVGALAADFTVVVRTNPPATPPDSAFIEGMAGVSRCTAHLGLLLELPLRIISADLAQCRLAQW